GSTRHSNTIAVSGYGCNINTSNITVSVNISHSWAADLEVYLVAPNGQVLRLADGNGGERDGFNVTFSDAGATSPSAWPTTNGPQITGTYRPIGGLVTMACGGTSTVTTFGGLGSGSMNPNGNWTLFVSDDAGGDGGTWVNWTLNIPSCTYDVSSTNTYTDFNNIVINPPSAGTFFPSTPTVCQGVQNFISSLNGQAGYTFQWSTTNLSGAGSASIASPTAGTTNITFTNSSTTVDYVVRVNLVVNSQCCGPLATLQTDVTVKPTPAVAIASGATICPGSNYTIVPTPVSGINFKYYDNAGVTLLGAGPSFTTPNLVSTATYRVIAENASGCEAPFTN
ncbi:MAG: proprotein convertase P-domain-containing protein, partial [Bacteroidia bacterium]